MALYTQAGEKTTLKPGDILAFDLKLRTLCINRPPTSSLYFGEGSPRDNKAYIAELASSRYSAGMVAHLMAHIAGLKLTSPEPILRSSDPNVAMFELME